ncbi:hypothetical protein LSAT2_013909, partial [Lamellibrachia satsuma]
MLCMSTQILAAANEPGTNKSRLLYLWDRDPGHRFLENIEVSVFLATRRDRRIKNRGESLIAANGSALATYDTRNFRINIDIR